ncbi:MAG: S66 peptidase family protein [Candidatus Sumerlaeaceae bacterium]
MAIVKPAKLERGMTVGVIAPSGSIRNLEPLERGIANLKSMGFSVHEGKFLRSRYGFLAGHDDDRLADLHRMFENRKVDAIFCARGGYGTSRLAGGINYELVRRNPKIFVGFSDITYLSLAFMKMCKLVTFNGPMVNFIFGDAEPRSFPVEGLQRTICEARPAGSIWHGHEDRNYRVVRHGAARGRLTGGNLSLLAASIGTAYEIDTRGKIVFLEEIEEQPYRIDRMLTQMISAGKLSNAAGIVIGRNIPHAESLAIEQAAAARGLLKTMPAPKRRVANDYDQTMDDIFNERLRGLGVPVISGLPFGHIKDLATLPVGIMASMDSKSGDLTIEEAAVK